MAFQPNAFQGDAFELEDEEEAVFSHGQAQAWIKSTYNSFGQTQAEILGEEIVGDYTGILGIDDSVLGKSLVPGYFTEEEDLSTRVHGQAQAWIKSTYNAYSQAQGQIKQVYYAHGQAQGEVAPTLLMSHGQAQAVIVAQYYQLLDTFTRDFGPTTLAKFPLYSPDEFNYPDKGAYHIAIVEDTGQSTGGRFEQNVDSSSWEVYLSTIANSNDVTAFFDFFSTSYSITSDIQEVYFEGPPSSNQYTDIFFAPDFGNPVIVVAWDDDEIELPIDALEDGETYRLLVSQSGNLLKLKIWKLSEPEPVDWFFETTHDGFVVNTVVLAAGWRNNAGLSWVDNLTVLVPTVPIAQRYGQAQAFMLGVTSKHGQARAKILATTRRHGQARARIVFGGKHGQARAFIRLPWRFGQAQAWIKDTDKLRSGQAQASISSVVKNVYGQANALINSTAKVQSGQANALITNPSYFVVDTFTRSQSGSIGIPDIGPTWTIQFNPDDLDGAIIDGEKATVFFDGTNYEFIAAASPIDKKNVELTADIYINAPVGTLAGFNPYIEFDLRSRFIPPYGINYVWYTHTAGRWSAEGSNPPITAAQGIFKLEHNRWYKVRYIVRDDILRFKVWDAQEEEPPTWVIEFSSTTHFQESGATGFWSDTDSSGVIGQGVWVDNFIAKQAATEQFGQAQALLIGGTVFYSGHGQAQALIKTEAVNRYGQAQASINSAIKQQKAQAQGYIRILDIQYVGQAQARIETHWRHHAQTQALILFHYFGQTKSGQAQAYIHRPQGYGQARAVITGGSEPPIFCDQFDRVTVSPNINSPDIGPDYTEVIVWGDDSTGNANGDELQVTGTESYSGIEFRVPIQLAEFDILTEIKHTVVNNWLTYFNITLREANINYRWDMYYDADDDDMSLSAPGEFESVHIPKLIDDTWYSIRVIHEDNDAKIKIWVRDDPEPGTWTFEKIDYQNIDGESNLSYFRSGIPSFYFDTGEPVDEEDFFDTPQSIFIDSICIEGTEGTITFDNNASGQAQAYIRGPVRVVGQAQALINRGTQNAQAMAFIKGSPRRVGQAQAFIVKAIAHGQAQAFIGHLYPVHGQTQAYISNRHYGQGNAQALITKPQRSGQAMAQIISFSTVKSGNARAKILSPVTKYVRGQAQALIYKKFGATNTGQAAALIDGTKYLVRYHNYDLPGYAQEEAKSSPMDTFWPQVTFEDSDFGEHLGLQNKLLSLRMKVVGPDYTSVKTQVQKAHTLLRSSRGMTKLYIGASDRYYLGLTNRISMENTAAISRTLDYYIEWHVKPWQISDRVYTIEGTGTIDTDIVERDFTRGGWTPTRMSMDGTNITISGYTEYGHFAGFASVSGTVTNLVIDSESYTATVNGINVNEIMYTPNYQVFVGPGKTTYVITGATRFELSYQDRWYL